MRTEKPNDAEVFVGGERSQGRSILRCEDGENQKGRESLVNKACLRTKMTRND